MKKIKLSLIAMALLLGAGGAFASELDATAWFYLDQNDQPVGTGFQTSPQCASGNQNCAQMYTVDGNGNAISPVGSPRKGAKH